ncbi:hypothetical protein ASZ78_015586 [Callipepla squamata]|uniref:SUN domain-containing protein n=1 Tax=Callipepla squamata TaxID=9009 RepID=A0A226M9W2_CALSU|nr:hypothetical protein ASZ78_015586 [Callipepla squamata]
MEADGPCEPGFVGIRFCQECNNMLYPKEDKESRVLLYAPAISPGECWPMEGHQGQVVIRLPAEILPTCVTVQHIFQEMSPSSTVGSAPKDVAVSGLDLDREEEFLLGSFTFDVAEEPIQTFLLKNNPPRSFRYIKFLVKSNWGNPTYTCIYRVMVHGKVVNLVDNGKSAS